MWGLSPSDNNAAIDAYKAQYGITNPCAGTEGGGPDAIDVVIEGQTFLGYPTYCIICPDQTMSFDVCWPPQSALCFDPYIEDCMANSLLANFTSDMTDICEMDMVTFTDLSSGDITSWEWTFEGGDPATSTEQNPMVTYNDQGEYDVELTVSDGTNSNTMLMEDFISVLMTPPAMLLPLDDVCVGWPAFELTGGSPAGGEYSGPGVSNGWFDPAVAGLGTHIITYTYTASNGCDNSDEQSLLVDPCTGIDEFEAGKINIYPNPSNGKFDLKLNYHGSISIKVVNIIGVTIYSEQITASGELIKPIDLFGFEEGIYFVTLQTEEKTYVKKLKLLN